MEHGLAQAMYVQIQVPRAGHLVQLDTVEMVL